MLYPKTIILNLRIFIVELLRIFCIFHSFNVIINLEVINLRWFYNLPRVIKDLIVFNSFIFMVQFIMNYGLNKNLIVRSNTLMAANAGILIVSLLKYRIDKIREEERNVSEKK